MNGYLLDSDILIWHLWGNQDVAQLLQGLADRADLAVSSISVLEVQVGVRPGEEARTNAFLDGLVCVAADRQVANRAGEYIRAYRAKGVTLDFTDSLIAATATTGDLTLVTRNISHYPMPDLRVLAEPET